MKIRSFALLAISLPICLSAASSGAQLAIYYSFDVPPSAALVNEIQAEMNRVLGDGGVRIAWRPAESPRNGEDFPGVVFLRFQGTCSWDHGSALIVYSDPAGQPLAETDISNGHVLPFGAVKCDTVRNFIASVLKSSDPQENDIALGRAIARVSAHEIYHMLTGSEEHSRHGIARGAHSRADLTAPRFAFAEPQMNWLRAWASKSASGMTVAAATGSTNDTVPSESTVSGGADIAGR